ncbi:hypothetical protein [Streptomyces erythrochromogenes]|uniref:hypothetical protein n=1 Tax=Streptomyces erythrochromogenes TaxID=285574 RepID=UPI00380CA830
MGAPTAYERRALPSGKGGLALELARTADVLEYARWEVQHPERDLDEDCREDPWLTWRV